MAKIVKKAPPAGLRLYQWLLDNLLANVRLLLHPMLILATAAGVGGKLFWLLRNEALKRRFAVCGEGVRLHGRITVTAPQKLHIGRNVHVNSNAFIRAEGGVFIEDNVHVSRNLVLYSMNHHYHGERLPYDASHVHKPVRIERNVWIGMNVSIVPGMTIGEGAIIGMGTVVCKDVPPLAIVGSPPPRILKFRDAEHYAALEQDQRYGGMSGFEKG